MDVFRTVFETYWTDLWYFARRSVPGDIAEDIVQDVMADLWRRRDAIDPNITFAQYLFKAVRNRVSNHWRHERTSLAVEAAYEPDTPMGMGTASMAPDHLTAANDVEMALVFAIRQLSEIQRAVLTLRWVHEMTYEQVAEVLSISPDAARQHGSRAQRTIRIVVSRLEWWRMHYSLPSAFIA
jgi:RNA polymerase sigma-70 factor (ECF subfamily)